MQGWRAGRRDHQRSHTNRCNRPKKGLTVVRYWRGCRGGGGGGEAGLETAHQPGRIVRASLCGLCRPGVRSENDQPGRGRPPHCSHCTVGPCGRVDSTGQPRPTGRCPTLAHTRPHTHKTPTKKFKKIKRIFQIILIIVF